MTPDQRRAIKEAISQSLDSILNDHSISTLPELRLEAKEEVLWDLYREVEEAIADL